MLSDGGLYILTYCLHEYSHELSCCHSMFFQFYQLPSCNSFTQQLCFIILGEIPLVKPWPPVHSFTLIRTLFTCFSPSLACWSVFTFTAFNHIFHTIRLIFCFQQEGKIDNLPGSLGTRKFCVLCVGPFNLAEALYSYWFDNLGFITEGNLLLHYFTPYTWGSQRVSSALSPRSGSVSFLKERRSASRCFTLE